MPVFRAIIFDLDDTLYPERAYVFSGFQAVAAWAEEHLGIPTAQGMAELWQLFNNGVRGDTFNRWLESHGFRPDAWVPRMVQIYREHIPRIEPYPEVPRLLQRLRLRYHLGLITDGYAQVQKRKLEALGLMSYFDVIVFSDELGRDAWKPNSKVFKVALEMLGITGPEAVYVADNPMKDFIGARRVGIWTVRVRHPDGLYSHLAPPSPEHAPDFEIETLDDLEMVLIRGELIDKEGFSK